MSEPIVLVGGWVDLAPADRDKYVEMSMERMNFAQSTPGCLCYVVYADPTRPDRVRIFEHFESPAAFDVHIKDAQEGRAPKPPQGLDVKERQIVIYDAQARPSS
jgi:quinol monooxygenase YgiN